MCGDAVCPNAAEALVRANFPARATRIPEPAMTGRR